MCVWQSQHQVRRAVSIRASPTHATAPAVQLRGADTEAREALARAAHLESHLREREKLLVKADKRYQELARYCSHLSTVSVVNAFSVLSQPYITILSAQALSIFHC